MSPPPDPIVTPDVSAELDLTLPTPPEPLPPHSTPPPDWATFMRETALRTRRWLERNEDHEQRARSRNPDPFVWL